MPVRPIYSLYPLTIAALLAVAPVNDYFQRPHEFRRPIGLEFQAAIGAAKRYEAQFSVCAAQNGERLGLGHFGDTPADLVRGISAEMSFKYPAIDDRDAVTFAESAWANCDLARVDWLKPRFFTPLAAPYTEVPVYRQIERNSPSA